MTYAPSGSWERTAGLQQEHAQRQCSQPHASCTPPASGMRRDDPAPYLYSNTYIPLDALTRLGPDPAVTRLRKCTCVLTDHATCCAELLQWRAADASHGAKSRCEACWHRLSGQGAYQEAFEEVAWEAGMKAWLAWGSSCCSWVLACWPALSGSVRMMVCCA